MWVRPAGSRRFAELLVGAALATSCSGGDARDGDRTDGAVTDGSGATASGNGGSSGGDPGAGNGGDGGATAGSPTGGAGGLADAASGGSLGGTSPDGATIVPNDADAPLQDSGTTSPTDGDADVSTPGEGGITDASSVTDGDTDGAARVCPIGVSDGCCALLVNGGTDPDCPSLDCDTLELSTPILLPAAPVDPTGRGYQSGTAMAWTGSELVLARLAFAEVSPVDGEVDLLVEWRDRTGNVLRSKRIPQICTNCLNDGPTALAYEPVSQRFFFAYERATNIDALIFDHDGNSLWTDYTLSEKCYHTTAQLQVYAGSGKFVLASDNQSCNGVGGRESQAYVFAPDGTELSHTYLADNVYDGSYACNQDCSEVFTYHEAYYGSGAIGSAVLDTETEQLTGPVTQGGVIYGGIRYSLAASNGVDYMTLSANHISSGTRRAYFRYMNSSLAFFGSSEYTSTRDGLPGSMAWTGAGFVAAVPTYEPDGDPRERSNMTIDFWHVDATGSIRQSFALDPTNTGLYPRITWAEDRMAVTWVRTPDCCSTVSCCGTNERYLAFLTCIDDAG